MLYVHRAIHGDSGHVTDVKYGIVDTEDGIETVVSEDQLNQMCVLVGCPSDRSIPINIKGVEFDWEDVNWHGEVSPRLKVQYMRVYKGDGRLPDSSVKSVSV